MKVSNMTSNNGNKIANQFIITDLGFKYYQSYNSMIVKIDLHNTYLDKKYWNFSNTTSKYRNKFLNETTKETQAKIKSGNINWWILMIKQIMIVSIMITFILFLGYLGIEYLIAQLINDVFAQIESK